MSLSTKTARDGGKAYYLEENKRENQKSQKCFSLKSVIMSGGGKECVLLSSHALLCCLDVYFEAQIATSIKGREISARERDNLENCKGKGR